MKIEVERHREYGRLGTGSPVGSSSSFLCAERTRAFVRGQIGEKSFFFFLFFNSLSFPSLVRFVKRERLDGIVGFYRKSH